MSTSTIELPEAVDTRKSELSLGAMLRHARERQGLTSQDIAQQLKLGVALVEALEREDLAALPDQVYVKGYLRRLAGALQLDSAQVQEAFTSLAGETRQESLRSLAPVEPMRPAFPVSSSRRFPWGRLALVVAVLAGGVYASRFIPETWLEGIEHVSDTTLNLGGGGGLDGSCRGGQAAIVVARRGGAPFAPPVGTVDHRADGDTRADGGGGGRFADG